MVSESIEAAAIYCRISKDPGQDHLGVDRQRADCEKRAAELGWTIGDYYIDDDQSADQVGTRPSYNRLVEDMIHGRVDAIIVWDFDRLHRQPLELEQFFEVARAAGVKHLASYQGSIDLASSDGQLYARILGAVSRKENDDKKRRLRRKHQELAETGQWKGGRRPYGYDYSDKQGSRPSGPLKLVPAEASVIKDAAARVLAGESLYSICNDLNQRNVATARGASWRTPTLRGILMSPKVAAFREYKGEVVGKAVWPEILDERTWYAVKAALKARAETRARPARVNLLTGGLAVCGRCGAPLKGSRRQSGVRILSCIKSPDHNGCGRLQVVAEPLEAAIVGATLDRLDSGALERLLEGGPSGGRPVDEIEAELTGVEAKFDELRSAWLQDGLPRDQLVKLSRELEGVREGLQAELGATVRKRTLPAGIESGQVLRRRWPDLSLDQQRAILRTVIQAVVVAPAARAGGRFDIGRVDVRWYDEDDANPTSPAPEA